MKKALKRILALTLCLAVILSITACGGTTFQISETGYITWKPIRGAVEYECAMVDGSFSNEGFFFLTEPGYQLEEGYCLHVRPVFKDGSVGGWSTSDYFGQPKINSEIAQGEAGEGDSEISPEEWEFHNMDKYVDPKYDVEWEDLSCFDVIGAIRSDSFRELEDGLVAFEADGPHGVMRFEGKHLKLENGQLVFEPGARIWGLDAIGRICAIKPIVADSGSNENYLYFSGGYTFSDKTSVDSHEELMYVWGLGHPAYEAMDEHYYPLSMMEWQANFVIFGNEERSPDAFVLSGLEIYYDTTRFTSEIRHMELDDMFYGLYLEGERYEEAREVYDLNANVYTFYLGAVPELENERTPYDPTVENCFEFGRAIIAFTSEQFKTGALRTADGSEVDRSTPLATGMTIDVTVGNQTCSVALPVYERYKGAQNLAELAPYLAPGASGEMNAILVPVSWQDQPEGENAENLLALKSEVGRVIENGTVKDYSDQISNERRFSLSEYFDIVSYGKLNISTFVTDWFRAPFNFSEYEMAPIDDEAFLATVYEWLMNTYPNMDWTDYDRDGNGYFDALMFINVGTSSGDVFYPFTFSGGACHHQTYNGGRKGTQDKPTINTFINVNASLLDNNTLLHEFGHNLGLIDYYDVNYTGIDAVGCFDMQSGSYGDWNAYSKYAVGWITPEIVNLQPGESVEYTIGAFCDTGDAILIPVEPDTFDGPFNEYILIDLFTDDGVNVYDVERFGLKDVSGVRVYHIDARMEVHTEEAGGVSYTFGTPNKVNAYNPAGIYQVELIQAGKDNTFTDLENLRTSLSYEDLFQGGMIFTLEEYSEFFKDGMMDSGVNFPYTVEIVSVSDSEAVIRVTAE